MGLNANALATIRARLANADGLSDEQLLEFVLRTSSMWRSVLLANTLVARHGSVVQHGLFAGMQYVRHATEGALLPRLLGSYEAELHPHIHALAQEGLDCVLDVGCAEGYYAVGLARLMPGVTVDAYDTDPAAQRACAELAALNGVSDRVKVGAAFDGHGFERYADSRTLVFMDIEGGERSLLDPVAFPALRTLKIVVETHASTTHSLTAEIAARFEGSHDIIRVDQMPKAVPLPGWLRSMGHLDQLLAVWEWRRLPTPWLVMRPKDGGAWRR